MYGAQRYGQNKYTGIVLDYHKVVRPVIGGPTVNLPAQDWLALATAGGDFPIPADQAQLTLALARTDQLTLAAAPQFLTQAVETAGQLTVHQSGDFITAPVPAGGRFTVNIPVADRITRGLN